MKKSKGSSPRKFAEKIALLNKKEAEATAEFEKIIKEVEETTRAPVIPIQNSGWRVSVTNGPQGVGWITPNTRRVLRHSQCHYQPLQHPSQQRVINGTPLVNVDNGFRVVQGDLQYVIAKQNQHQPVRDQTQQHQIQQQQQQQQQQLIPNQNIESGCDTQTPIEVPNIQIFPIEDDEFNGHQQVNSSYRNNVYSIPQISATRSLPDIANLGVEYDQVIPILNPAYSDQRLPNDHDYNYELYASDNPNSMTEPNARNYCSQNTLPVVTTTENACYTTGFSQDSTPHLIHQHGLSHTKASSTNAIPGNWNESNNLLNAPPTMAYNYLSKSTEATYGYLRESSLSNEIFDDNNTSESYTTGTTTTSPMNTLRTSSSYTDIETLGAMHQGDSTQYRFYNS